MRMRQGGRAVGRCKFTKTAISMTSRDPHLMQLAPEGAETVMWRLERRETRTRMVGLTTPMIAADERREDKSWAVMTVNVGAQKCN